MVAGMVAGAPALSLFIKTCQIIILYVCLVYPRRSQILASRLEYPYGAESLELAIRRSRFALRLVKRHL